MDNGSAPVLHQLHVAPKSAKNAMMQDKNRCVQAIVNLCNHEQTSKFAVEEWKDSDNMQKPPPWPQATTKRMEEALRRACREL